MVPKAPSQQMQPQMAPRAAIEQHGKDCPRSEHRKNRASVFCLGDVPAQRLLGRRGGLKLLFLFRNGRS
ncbi:hypothetical protein PC116_g10598 [Phytophthora cactorum]|nr:hypothetical protein PC114_g8602 [Phytophthora cactorum]KAG3185695.1 hypothetical protein C6341_g4296 [Phytophthora cactorum]KAG4241449.1 hypothetical protein PC116_g10598 [Phytophthora cactorum]